MSESELTRKRREMVEFAKQVCHEPELPAWVELEEAIEEAGLAIRTSAESRYHGYGGPEVVVRVRLEAEDPTNHTETGYATAYGEVEDEETSLTKSVLKRVAEALGLKMDMWSPAYKFNGSDDAVREKLRNRYPGLYRSLLHEALLDLADSIEKKRQRKLEELERFNEERRALEARAEEVAQMDVPESDDEVTKLVEELRKECEEE